MERHVQPSDSTDCGTGASPPGSSSLADALHALDTLADRPLEEHISTYETLHERLQAELGSIDGG
jgi:hypothetical protein